MFGYKQNSLRTYTDTYKDLYDLIYFKYYYFFNYVNHILWFQQ